MKPAPSARGLAWIVAALMVFAWPTAAFAISVLTQFEGLANSNNAVMGLPPDNGFAAGPNHLFEMVNSSGRITDKSGTDIQTFSLDSFFAVDADFDSSDPQVI